MSRTAKSIFEHRPTDSQAVAVQLRRAIEQRRIRSGERLPTIREMMAETGLPYGTINRALGILAEEGLVTSRKRAGTFVTVSPTKADAPNRNVFALVLPELHTGFYVDLVKAVEASAAEVGRRMIACSTNNDVHKQADIIVQLMAEGVSGVVLLPATIGPPPRHQIQMLHRQGVPVVLMHRGVEGVTAPQLLFPAEEIGQMACRAMIERGHRRIGMVATHRSNTVAGYERGLRRAMSDAGIRWRDDWAFVGDLVSIDPLHDRLTAELTPWLTALMAQSDRPTALFTSFVSVGEILYLTALQMGLRVPEDLSIVTVSGAERLGALARQLATVMVDESHAGSQAVELLEAMAEGRLAFDATVTSGIQIAFDPGQSLADLRSMKRH